MKKPVYEWLNHFPQNVRQKIYDNFDPNFSGLTMDYVTGNLKYVLENAFDWDASPEGSYYWEGICCDIGDNCFPAPLEPEYEIL